MELLNSTLDLASQGWSYYIGTMMNFKEAHPVLALFTFSGLLVAITYLAVKSFMAPKTKPDISVFDIKARLENPAWYTKGILYVLEQGLIVPFFATLEFLVVTIINTVFALYIFGMKIYFSLKLKRIKSSKF